MMVLGCPADSVEKLCCSLNLLFCEKCLILQCIDGAHGRVMMESTPTTPLEIIQAGILLEFLMVTFDAPNAVSLQVP